jgi:quercetin dioxygenase-like cupin family protein
MTNVSRRSAMILAAAATATIAETGSVLAQGSALTPTQGQLPKGVTRKVWGKREAMLSGYKNVEMTDLVYQPGAKTENGTMPSDMVCHVPQGELRIKKTDGMQFTAKQGDVWTCKKGEGETVENAGKTVGIMRVIQLLA